MIDSVAWAKGSSCIGSIGPVLVILATGAPLLSVTATMGRRRIATAVAAPWFVIAPLVSGFHAIEDPCEARTVSSIVSLVAESTPRGPARTLLRTRTSRQPFACSKPPGRSTSLNRHVRPGLCFMPERDGLKASGEVACDYVGLAYYWARGWFRSVAGPGAK